jgi:hypothetical protein
MEAQMSSPTAEQLFVERGTAEEICKVLERTLLKYFPPHIDDEAMTTALQKFNEAADQLKDNPSP